MKKPNPDNFTVAMAQKTQQQEKMAKQRAERIQKEYSELVLMMDNWDEQKQYDITKYSTTLGVNFRIQVPVGSI